MPDKDGFPTDAELDDAHRRSYASSLADWNNWFSAADELEVAASLLKPRVASWWAQLKAWDDEKTRPRKVSFPARGCHAIYMMLAAFVIENLAKGGLLRTRRVTVSTLFEPDERLPETLKTHDLCALIRLVEMRVDEGEEELLQRLTRAAVWRARYPVATKFSEMRRPVTLANGKQYSSTWFGAKDIERTEGLVARLRDHIGAPRNDMGARDAAP